MSTPYFYINGHDYKIDVDATSTSEINLVKNKMFVSSKSWGYTDIQWTNFTGETIPVKIYTRADELYKGEEAQPEHGGGDSNFYKKNVTSYSALKYWAQTFVPCKVVTNIPAFEDATYVIDEFSQTSPSSDWITTEMKLIQYEKPAEVEQTYWTATDSNKNSSTGELSASYIEVKKLDYHNQTCSCTSTTSGTDCSATVEEEVKTIQKYLRNWGYFLTYSYTTGKVPITGKYCYYTTQAIKQFQEDYNLTVTGNFDYNTKEAFLKKLKG